MSAEARRESLLNAPALLFMSAVLLIAFWILFPRQPAFRDPANLSAKDALSVAYLRVLVQSDPENAPLRLSFVQLLTEAGMLDEAATAIAPLQTASSSTLTYEIRLTDLRLALQQLYRRPEPQIEQALRARIAELIPSLLSIARNDKELSQVVSLAEQFGEPGLLAETFEHLVLQKDEARDKKLRWLVFAGRQRLAANQPGLAGRNFLKAFAMEQNGGEKLKLAKSSLRAYLQAGLNQDSQREEALGAAAQVHENVTPDAEVLLLAADIAQPLAEHTQALAWLEEASKRLPGDQMLAERIVRLQLSMGLLADSLARADQLRAGLAPGSDRHRLLAEIQDWNGQSEQALAMWLSFARAKADPEAEARAFALAQAKPDNRALVQLLESVMVRRVLTQVEANAYVKAGLNIVQPGHVEQQLRRHAERFGNPPATLKALAAVLVLEGKPGAALAVQQDLPEAGNIRQKMDLARLYDEAGNAQKGFDLLLQEFDSPFPHTEEYWLLLAKLSGQLGQDSYARRAYEKALALRPADEEILEKLHRLATRHRDEKESERLARYGWERLGRIEDLQRLMQFSWKRENWAELDKWLSSADEIQSAKPSVFEQADRYWYFRAMRRMAKGEREAAEQALQQILKLRGPDPDATEALIWLLLSGKKVDHAFLDSIVQPFRSQSGSFQELSAPLVEALAAAEQSLGNPVQAAEWYGQSLTARPRDFLWTLTLADNMEWAGCPASANHVRFIALRFFASSSFEHANVRYPLRLAEYFAGHRDMLAQRGAWIGSDVSEKWLSVRENWRLAGSLDNADYFSLQRQTERLSSPAWQKFAGAVESKDERTVALQLKAISGYLEPQPGKKQISNILPLSLEDIDRAQRWLAGKASPPPGDVHAEADVCRQTLTKIRGLHRVSFTLEEQPAL